MNQSGPSQTSAKIHFGKEGIIFHFYGPVTVVLNNPSQPIENPKNRRLLIIYRRRLEKLQEKEALLGINTPPEILVEIEDLQEKIMRLRTE